MGASFFVSAWKAVRRKTANMAVLVVLGTMAAYLVSSVCELRINWLLQMLSLLVFV